jgi:hypothetical protein
MKYAEIYLLLLMANASLFSQSDSVLLTKNFKFKDGIYLTLQDFQKNQPNYTWSEVVANLATSDEGFIAQVEQIRTKEQSLDLQQVWGICIGGLPYIRLPEGEVTDAATIFAGLRVRGKICYFSYKIDITEMQMVKAYNPLTGRPFRQGKVPVEKRVEVQLMLDFQTGKVTDFTKENFMNWIENDQQLWATVKDLSPEETQEKLFKCLLIYIDRNAVYLKIGG